MRRIACALVALGVAVPSVGARAQNTEWNRYTLEHLGGVFVSVVANDACEGAGVMASTFEASTSLKLIEGEVGVLTREEMLANPALPELRVSLDCAGGAGGTLAYSVGLRLQQAAQMLRDTQLTLPEAVTWYTAQLGVTDAGHASEAVGSALDEKLVEFVEAWTAANAEAEEGSR